MPNSTHNSEIEPHHIPDQVCYEMEIIRHIGADNMHSIRDVRARSEEIGLKTLTSWLDENVIDEPAGAYTSLLKAFPERAEQADMDFTKFCKIGSTTDDDGKLDFFYDSDSYTDLDFDADEDILLSVDPANLKPKDIPRSVCRQMGIIQGLGTVNMHDYRGVREIAVECRLDDLIAWLDLYVINADRSNKENYMTLLQTFPERMKKMVFDYTTTPFSIRTFYRTLGIDDKYIQQSETGVGVINRLEEKINRKSHVPLDKMSDALDETIDEEIKPHESQAAVRVYTTISKRLRNYHVGLFRDVYAKHSDSVPQQEECEKSGDFVGLSSQDPHQI